MMQNERKQGYLGVRMTDGDLGPIAPAYEHARKWLDEFHPMYQDFQQRYHKKK